MAATLDLVQSVVSIAAVVVPPSWLAIRRLREQRGHLTWGAVRRGVKILHQRMLAAGYRPAYVVCLGRSGAIVGAMLSSRFGKPNIPIIVLTIEHSSTTVHEHFHAKGQLRAERVDSCGLVQPGLKNVLVIGVDIVNGGAMRAALSALDANDVAHSATACLYVHPNAYLRPDFFAYEHAGRLRFPWMLDKFERTWDVSSNKPVEDARP